MPQAVEERVCADMISKLPEDLLIRIFWCVPTKDAVATMFLSKRWLSIWTMKVDLEFIDSDVDDDSDEDDDDDEKSKKSVWWFLDKSMQLHKAPILFSLCMELGRRCPTDANVGKWVANAVDRGVFDMIIKLRWSADPVSLPKSLYTCKSLNMLSLSHKILVDVLSPVFLPSLKILKLWCVAYKNDDSLVRFLSGCPVLEKLVVRRDKDDNVTNFCIKVPSLKILSYHEYRTFNARCLVIDTPGVKHLDFTAFSEDYCSIENMPCLDDTRIRCFRYHDDKFLKSLSLVMDLELLLVGESLAYYCSTINFSRLAKLSISPVCDWLEPLMLLLGNSPQLKCLLVNYELILEPEDLPLSWNQPSSVPGCLSSHLETFEWKEYGGRQGEEQFLTYILGNAKCLKTATITLKSACDFEDKEKKLRNIPRGSPASQLLLKTKTMEIVVYKPKV